MENGNELIRAIIDRKIKESLMAQSQQSNSNIMDRLNNIGSRTNNIGEGLSNIGNYLNNNTALNGIASKAQSIGGALQSGANVIKNAIPSLASNTAIAGGASSAAGGAASGAAMSNPIGAIVALGAMALSGTNRNRAKKAGQQAEQLANNAIEQNRAKLPILENNSIIPSVASPLPNANNNIQQNIPSSIEASSKPTLRPSEAIVPQSSEDLKKMAFHKLANGFDDFLAGYNENKNQGFNWNNLKSDDSKGIMQRLGEGVGTIARISQNPVAQGVIAGGLSGLLSGDPLYGLSSAYKYANSKYKANLYKDILEQQGVSVGNNNGIIDANDLSKILTSRKFQKDYMTRSDYDKFRLDNGQITTDEYNALINNPDYNGNEVLNISGLESVAKAGKYAQENKESRSKNYWRNVNQGKNIVKVEYGDKPDSHNYTHVTYGERPESKNTTYVKYSPKPQTYTPPKTITQIQTKPAQQNNNTSNERVKVQSPEGKVGTIPKNQLLEALKNGFKKIK